MKLVNLIPLKEIDFRNQDQFDDYTKNHELRPDTKVTINGKVTTAGQAAKNSKPVKGTSVFGKGGGSVFGNTGGASAKSDKVASKPDGMATVNSIASKTGLRAQAVAGWADENGVNLSKVSADIDSKKLKPMDLMTAVSGNPGNKYAKDIIAKYSQSGSSSNMGVDSVVYNKRTNSVGIVRIADERGETKTDADGNVNTSDLEPYNPMKYPHQKNAQAAPSTKREVDSRGLWNPFNQKDNPKVEPKANDVEALTSYKDFNKFFKANSDKLNKNDLAYIEDEIGALKYLESDYKRGDADWDEVEVAYIELQDLIKKAMSSSMKENNIRLKSLIKNK